MWLNDSMEQSPSWEDKRFSASQEIPRILRNPNVHHRIHNSPPTVFTLSQIDPVHAPHPTSRRSILILPSHLRLGLPSYVTKPVWTLSLSLAASGQDLCFILECRKVINTQHLPLKEARTQDLRRKPRRYFKVSVVLDQQGLSTQI
jgi:hypothetical protein